MSSSRSTALASQSNVCHHWRSDRDDVPSLSCIDSLPEGSVGLNEELASPNTKAKDLIFKNSSSDIPDDSLTSLKWLHEFSIHRASERQQVISTSQYESNLLEQQLGGEAPASHLAGDLASIGMPLTPGKPTATALSALDTLPSLIAHGHCPDEVDYKTNPHIRPPYSYATLICMAIQASKKSKITLSNIYKWITDNFCYFHHANPTWQNSIRHSLSLNKCFRKVPRQKDEPGKGGFWTIDPEYAERLLTGAYKMQRMPPVQINSVLKNKLRMNSQRVMTVPENVTGVFQVNPESQQLLKEAEGVTGLDQNWDPRLAETTSFDCRSAVKGQKRKPPYGHRAGSAKVLCRSTSPLLSMEEPKVLPSNFDWDALLNSVLYGDLSLNEVVPLSPIPDDQDLVEHGINVSSIITTLSTAESSMLIETQKENNVDFEEETFLATEFLESPWKEEEDWNPPDFLCTSTADINQLFDLRDLLSDDTDSKLQRISSLISSSVSLDSV